jgi:hypothetical protein
VAFENATRLDRFRGSYIQKSNRAFKVLGKRFGIAEVTTTVAAVAP